MHGQFFTVASGMGFIPAAPVDLTEWQGLPSINFQRLSSEFTQEEPNFIRTSESGDRVEIFLNRSSMQLMRNNLDSEGQKIYVPGVGYTRAKHEGSLASRSADYNQYLLNWLNTDNYFGLPFSYEFKNADDRAGAGSVSDGHELEVGSSKVYGKKMDSCKFISLVMKKQRV